MKNFWYAERSPQMPFLNLEPFFDPLRADTRFQESRFFFDLTSDRPLTNAGACQDAIWRVVGSSSKLEPVHC